MNRQMIIVIALLAMPGNDMSSLAQAGELPRLRIYEDPPGDVYEPQSSIVVTGDFTPAYQTKIKVGIYHVLPTGRLVRQAGCSFAPRPDGKFSITFDPPAVGWIPGSMRAVVTLADLPQVTASTSFAAAGEAVAVPWTPIPERKSSDLVVRLPLAEVKVFELPPKVTYLVEGELRSKEPMTGVTGPRIFVSLEHIREDATRVTYDNAIGPSFVQQDGSSWYQIQLKSPDKPGLYHVKLKVLPPHEAIGEAFGTSEFPFSIRVSEEKAAAPKP